MICLDTGAVIAAVQENLPHPDQQRHRRLLLPYLARQPRERILVPAVVVAEFLYGIHDADRDQATGRLSRDFVIAPFDLPSAVRAVAIRRRLVGSHSEKEAIRSHGGTANKFRADIQVIAIAMASDCRLLVTADRPLATASRQVGLQSLHIADIPPPPTQLDIFSPPGC